MRVKILQPFTCSRDGGSVDLRAGMEADISGDSLLLALEQGGYVTPLEDEPAIPAPIKAPVSEPVDAAAILEALDEVENASSKDLTVKHIGRGRYAVHRGDERVSEPMTKEDAEAALAGMV